jgi:O-antigen/teichoic acid export membrane protein
MSIELPTINAIVARLPDAEVNLAAYGGVVFPIALTIEAPIIMLLAAATALSRDWRSYQRLKKITLWMGGILTALHLLVAITPMYDFIVNVILQVPEAVVEPGRAGLLYLTPWTFAIAYRRFQQGTMIRFGHSKMVGEATAIRLVTDVIVLAIGFSLGSIPGATLAGLTQAAGVTAEATYAGLRIRKIRHLIKDAPPAKTPLTLKRFIAFYIPLALTSSLWLLWMPLISGTVSRMPDPLESLAIWSVLTGLIFMFRTPGVAYNEAVVALLEEPCAFPKLRQFARTMTLVSVGLATIFVLSPLSSWWFRVVANLPPDRGETARITMGIAILVTIFSVYIHFFQGIIVQQEKTRPIAEATVVFLLTLAVVMVSGVVTEAFKGIYVAAAGYTLAHLTQGLWLMIRSRKQRKILALCQ